MDQITSDNIRDTIEMKKWICTNELRSLERGSRTNFDTLKSRITDDTYTVRNLYERPVTVQNVNNYCFSTNNMDSIKIGLRDRRYLVLEVSDERVGDIAYFSALLKTFTPEFYEHLLNYLLRYEITAESGFDPYKPMETELKHAIKEMSMSLPEQFMEQFVWKPREAANGLTAEQLWKKYVDWVDAMSLEREQMGKSGVAFGMKIKRFVRTDRKKSGGRTKLYYYPLVAPVKEDDEPAIVSDDTDDEADK
jgi:hypothetical protein